MGLVGSAALGLVIGWVTLLVSPAVATLELNGRSITFLIAGWGSAIMIAWYYASERGALLTAIGLVVGLAVATKVRPGRRDAAN